MRLLLTPIERNLLWMNNHKAMIKKPFQTAPNGELHSDQFFEYLNTLQDNFDSQKVKLTQREIEVV